MKHCRPEPGIKRHLKETHTGSCYESHNDRDTIVSVFRSVLKSFSPSHQREGVDGVVHGALAWHRAAIAQQHEKASQAVKQRGQGRGRLLETQEARKWPLWKIKYRTFESNRERQNHHRSTLLFHSHKLSGLKWTDNEARAQHPPQSRTNSCESLWRGLVSEHKPCRGTVGPCTPRPGKAPQWSTCTDSDSHRDMSNLGQGKKERGGEGVNGHNRSKVKVQLASQITGTNIQHQFLSRNSNKMCSQ